MAVVIRLARHGKKNSPFYRVVATNKRAPRDGSFLEVLGTFNPKNKQIQVDKERIQHWLSKGAVASQTVEKLLAKAG